MRQWHIIWFKEGESILTFSLEDFFEEGTQKVETICKIFCDLHTQLPNFSGVKEKLFVRRNTF